MALLDAGLAASVLVLFGWMGRMLLAGKIPAKIFFCHLETGGFAAAFTGSSAGLL